MTLDRDKLAKILGLLSSDKIGEMVSAARAADALIRNANTSWAEVLKQSVLKQSVLKQSAIDDDAHALFAELRLGTENDKLREMVMRLSAENHALREQVARRLAHRILDRVKQSGQALLALAIAFERIRQASQQFLPSLLQAIQRGRRKRHLPLLHLLRQRNRRLRQPHQTPPRYHQRNPRPTGGCPPQK